MKDLIEALEIEKAGDWDRAHSIVQENLSPYGSWVHAYLHRVEGDLWNANYWYRRAGRSLPGISLEEEWNEIFRELSG